MIVCTVAIVRFALLTLHEQINVKTIKYAK